MAYQKYLSIPNRRGNVGDRDHFQHIENALKDVVPGPGEVIVGGAGGPVAVHRAMVPPAPMTARLLPTPKVMTAPPAVVVGTTNPMTGTVAILPDNPAFRYLRAIPTFGGDKSVSAGGLSVGRLPFMTEFMFDGAAFVLRMYPQRSQMRIRVNGELVTPGYDTTYSSETGSSVYIHVDLGSRANRHIEIEMNELALLMSLHINGRDTIWKPEVPVGPRVVVIGASWSTQNSPQVHMAETFPYIMGEALGWRDVRSSSLSGTGYLHNTPYRSRLETDVLPHKPDIVLVTGSGNDSSYTEAAIRTEAQALYDAIRAGLPNALLIVVEPFFSATPATPEITKVRTAIAAAAQSRGLPYIRTDGWITGSGHTGAQNATGNANYYITNNHPNRAGSAYLGRRLASAIAALSDGLMALA